MEQTKLTPLSEVVDYPCITHMSVDSFTEEKMFTWTKLAGFKLSGIPIGENGVFFYIRSIYKEGKFFLTFVFRDKHNKLKLKKGDTISLRFDNGSILDFTIASRPHKLSNDYILNDSEFWDSVRLKVCASEYSDRIAKMGIRRNDTLELSLLRSNISAWFETMLKIMKIERNDAGEVEFQLSSTDLYIFSKSLLVEYRVTYNSEGGISIQGGFRNAILDDGMCPCVIRNMFNELLKVVEQNVNTFNRTSITPSLPTSSQKHAFDYCYVYLMNDEANGYYKIGMSNDPTYREGTLQSEKPTIKLVASHKYPTRKIASAIEAALHNVYKDNHVRGEWYRLDTNDVLAIKETLEEEK